MSNSPDRWEGVSRSYSRQDVERMRGSIKIEYTLAKLGAERLWKLLHSEAFVPALGALTGNQAVQQVQAGLKAIYLSGWQVAADANTGMTTYPDLSLYPVDSVPKVVERINNAFQRADQIAHSEGRNDTYWYACLECHGVHCPHQLLPASAPRPRTSLAACPDPHQNDCVHTPPQVRPDRGRRRGRLWRQPERVRADARHDRRGRRRRPF
jgi:hypothetical protein